MNIIILKISYHISKQGWCEDDDYERCVDNHGQHKQRLEARIRGTYTYVRHLDKPKATHKSEGAQITQGKPRFKTKSLVK